MMIGFASPLIRDEKIGWRVCMHPYTHTHYLWWVKFSYTHLPTLVRIVSHRHPLLPTCYIHHGYTHLIPASHSLQVRIICSIIKILYKFYCISNFIQNIQNLISLIFLSVVFIKLYKSDIK